MWLSHLKRFPYHKIAAGTKMVFAGLKKPEDRADLIGEHECPLWRILHGEICAWQPIC